MNLDGYSWHAKAETPERYMDVHKGVAEQRQPRDLWLWQYARIQSFLLERCLDWYIELCKGRLLDGNLISACRFQRATCLCLGCQHGLLRPAMPFVTERLVISEWPDQRSLQPLLTKAAERSYSLAKTVVSAVRSSRAL